ncbi:MAG: relaxase [Chryseobacterium sp.]|nr:MAG: relaxase [Chryseobacterium sp.]
MVARIISGKSIRGLLNYNESKVNNGEASLILANRFGTEIERLDFNNKLVRFEHLTKLNIKVKTNALHIMLNFDRSDKVTTGLFQQIASSYMDRIGLGEQPFLVYQHKDVSHPHIHIVTTNIQSDGKRIDIHGLGRTLSETARKDLEIEYGLIKAEGRNRSEAISITPVSIETANYGKVPTKKAIYSVVAEVMRSYKFTSFAEYNAVLKQFNIIADRGKEDTLMFEKRGLVYSIIDKTGNRVGIPFKASELATRPTLDSVEKKFERNAEKKKPYKEALRKRIEYVFSKYNHITKTTLVAELENQGIALILRQNDQGLVYGATFIDHKSKSVFKGSDLGREYGAKAFLDRCGNMDRPKTYLKTNEQTKSYLKPITSTNYLNDLMESSNTDQVPTVGQTKKKRKKHSGFSR